MQARRRGAAFERVGCSGGSGVGRADRRFRRGGRLRRSFPYSSRRHNSSRGRERCGSPALRLIVGRILRKARVGWSRRGPLYPTGSCICPCNLGACGQRGQPGSGPASPVLDVIRAAPIGAHAEHKHGPKADRMAPARASSGWRDRCVGLQLPVPSALRRGDGAGRLHHRSQSCGCVHGPVPQPLTHLPRRHQQGNSRRNQGEDRGLRQASGLRTWNRKPCPKRVRMRHGSSRPARISQSSCQGNAITVRPWSSRRLISRAAASGVAR